MQNFDNFLIKESIFHKDKKLFDELSDYIKNIDPSDISLEVLKTYGRFDIYDISFVFKKKIKNLDEEDDPWGEEFQDNSRIYTFTKVKNINSFIRTSDSYFMELEFLDPPLYRHEIKQLFNMLAKKLNKKL